MADYFDALGQAYSQGYSHADIAEYHASQGWQPPPQPSIADLLANPAHPNFGMAQYGGAPYGGIASQAYQWGNKGISDQDVETPPGAESPFNPGDNAANASPTNVPAPNTQPVGSQPGDYVPPGTGDRDAEGALAPWETPNVNGVGSYVAPPSEQNI
jgi:hypothetical protein